MPDRTAAALGPCRAKRQTVKGEGVAGWLPNGRLIVWQTNAGRLRLLTAMSSVPVMSVQVSNSAEGKVASLSCSARVAAVRQTTSGYALDIYTRTNVTVRGLRRVRLVRRTVAWNRYLLG